MKKKFFSKKILCGLPTFCRRVVLSFFSGDIRRQLEIEKLAAAKERKQIRLVREIENQKELVQRKVEKIHNRLDIKKAKIENQLDREIRTIQSSNRISIKSLAPIHNYFKTKSKLYRMWFLNSHFSSIHLAVLFLFVAGSVYFIHLLYSPTLQKAYADAMTCTWKGTNSTSWDDSGNWDGCSSGIPATEDYIVFNSTATKDLILTSDHSVARVSSLDDGNFSRTFNTNGQTLTISETLTWQDGTLSAGSSEIKVAGDVDLLGTAGTGTFTYSSSTLTLTGSASNFTPKANLDLYALKINKDTNSTAVTINTNNFNIRDDLIIAKGKLDGSGRTVSLTQNDCRYNIGDSTGGTASIEFNTSTGSQYIDGSGGIANDNVVVNKTEGTLYYNGTATFKYLTLTDGTLNIQSGNLTFPASADGSAGKLSCASSKTLTIAGSSSRIVTFRSATPGSTWYFENTCGITTADYTDVKDSYNTNHATANIVATNSIDSGNNTGWDFATSPLATNQWIADTDSNWSNTANWSAGHVPTSGERAYFSTAHNGSCNIDTTVNVLGLLISDYSGTITQNSNSITIGTSAFTQNSGTFAGGDGAINFSGDGSDLVINGGTHTTTSATLTMGSYSDFIQTGGSFGHNGGTVIFSGIAFNNIDVPVTATFYNFIVNKSAEWTLAIASGDTIIVNSTLSLNDGMVNGGTIDLNGTLVSSSAFDGGSTNILINDGQTVNISDGWVLPSINLQNGTLNSPEGGTMTFDYVASLTIGDNGTFNHNSGTVIFAGAYSTINVSTALTLNNLTIDKNDNGWVHTIASGDTVVVNGTLTLTGGKVGTGTIDLNGTLVSSSTFGGGDATILIDDGQTVNIEDGWVLPSINLQNGTLNAPEGGIMTFGYVASLTIEDNGTFNHNSGTVIFAGAYSTINVSTALTLNNLTIDKNDNGWVHTIASGDTVVVNGTLTLTNGKVNTGTIEAKGNVVVESTFDGGTALINFIGTGTQTYTMTAGGVLPSGNITINKPSGSVVFSGTNTIKSSISLTDGSLEFTGGYTYTMTVGKTITASSGTAIYFNGSSGNLVTFDSSDGATAISITKPDGVVVADFVSINRTTVSGGATWYKTVNFTGSGNTGWTDSGSGSVRTVTSTGGNWSNTATWNEGAVPTAGDYVFATTGAGALTIDTASVARSVDLTGYTNTLTHNAAITLSIGDATVGANNNALKFSSTMTYTLGNSTTSAISFVSTSTTPQAITWAGKTPGNVTFNGVGGSWLFEDELSASSIILTLTTGTLNTNNQAVTVSVFNSNNSNTRSLTLGSSIISVSYNSSTAWNMSDTRNLTFNAGTSTINVGGPLSGMNVAGSNGSGQIFNVVNITGNLCTLNAPGSTFNTLNRVGSTKISTLTISADVTVTDTLTLSSSSPTTRLLVQSNTIGTARTLTATNVDIDNVDFQDITAAGAASPFTGVSLGDCGGNTNITTDTPVPQTWTNTSGGTWSTASNWTSRVPLPQDDVSFGTMDAGQTITVDVPRMGKNISFAGVTNTPTVLMNDSAASMSYSIYGSLDLTGVGTLNHVLCPMYFRGRTDSSVTSNGKIFGGSITIIMPDSTLTLNDSFSMTPHTSSLQLQMGVLTAMADVTTAYYAGSPGTTTNMGFGTWSMFSEVVGRSWLMYGLVNCGTSTLALTYTGSSANSFTGGNQTYNNIQIAPGTGTTTFSGSFTFANMTMSSAGTKTIKFTKSTTYTMTGSNFLSGTSGNLITIDSDDGVNTFDLVKTSGATVLDYVDIYRATASGGATFYLTTNSTQTNCTGFTTSGSGNIKTISAAGGNWSETTAWNEGAVPVAGDRVFGLASSGNLVVNVVPANLTTIDLQLYNGTLSGSSNITIVNSSSDEYVKINAGTFSWAGTLLINPASSRTAYVKTNSKACNITINGAGTLKIVENMDITGKLLTVSNGYFDTNNFNFTVGRIAMNSGADGLIHSSSSIVTLTSANTVVTTLRSTYQPEAGAVINNTGGTTITATGVAFETLNITPAGSVTIDIGSAVNLSRIGTAATTDSLTINANATITNTLTLQGNSTTNRLLVQSDTIGTARTITAANVDIDNVDFMDITAAGVASPFTGVSLGDCGGNTNITTDTPAAQTWTNTSGGTWSTASNWTTRVPLPQDDVSFGTINAGQTITVDMPRMGKNISFAGASNTVVVTMTTADFTYSVYGSLDLTRISSLSRNKPLSFVIRDNSQFTSAGINMQGHDLNVYAFGCSLTFSDFYTQTSWNTRFYNGTVVATNTMRLQNLVAYTGATLDLGGQLWRMGSYLWQVDGLITGIEGSTIQIMSTWGANFQFRGGNNTYNDIVIEEGSGTQEINFYNNFTFANMTMSAAGARTIKFNDTDTFTMTGDNFLNGTSGNPITIDSDDGVNNFDLVKTSGTVVADYINISRSNVSGGAEWYLTSNSVPYPDPTTQANTGWLIDTTLASNPSTTTATIAGNPVDNNGYTNIEGDLSYSFSGALDADSGVAGYYAYYGTDPNADPETEGDYLTHIGAEGDTQIFDSYGVIPFYIDEIADGSTFYFRIKTRDAV